MKKNDGRDELGDVFLTLDEDGRTSPGKRSTSLKDLPLRDGQILYISYIYARYEQSGKWIPSCLSDPTEMPRICGQCGKDEKTDRYINIQIGFTVSKICLGCLDDHANTLKKTDINQQLNEGKKTLICSICGNRGAVINEEPINMSLISKCLKCPTEPKNRICSFCDLPIESRLLCGKCKKKAYCSTICQRKDWSEHKLTCT